MTTKTQAPAALAILDKAGMDAAIKSITTMGKKYDALVHQAAVSAVDHHAKTGDVGYMNRLYLALGKGTRKAALSSWYLSYGGVLANTEGNKKEMPFKHSKDKNADVTAGTLDPWYDHKPDAEPDQVFDLAVAIEAIIKKAKGKQLQHGELLTYLQAGLVMVRPPEPVTAGDSDETPE